MDEKQIGSHYATEKRFAAAVLLFFSVTAGLTGVVMLPDLQWAAVIPGSLCVLTGWAALVLLFSASRVVRDQKVDEVEALLKGLPDTPQVPPSVRIEAEETSRAVTFASGLGAVAMVLLIIMGLVGKSARKAKQNPNHNPPPQETKHESLPGYSLSKAEEDIMLDVIIRHAKVYTDKDKKHVTAIDFSSSDRFEDDLLEQYSRDLPGLRMLDLRNTPVTDSGVRHLTTMQSLRRLRLGGTSVTAEQVDVLRLALPKCEIDTETEE